MELDYINLNCICMQQKLTDVKKFIDEYSLKTIEDVKLFCGAGTKCGLCIPYIEKLIKQNYLK